MPAQKADKSTGIAGLDRILKGILPGDNIVWHVDSVEEYFPFVQPFLDFCLKHDKKLIYFRFARHRPLVPNDCNANIIELHPEKGFEAFIKAIYLELQKNGPDACYIFDCLSDLADFWYSDRMLGNFFRLICPSCYEIGALAFFAIYRNYHSFHATTPIMETPQIFLEVYHHQEKFYLHPIKVQDRYSPSMNRLHIWVGEDLIPITDSATITDVFTSVPWFRLRPSSHELGIWNRTFIEVEKVLTTLTKTQELSPQAQTLKRRLIRMTITRHERVSQLVEKYLTLEDLFCIGKQVIGTGLIGGKSVGMLLARAILKKTDRSWKEILEKHDSFYIGSDVFYSFLVQNGIWLERERQKDPQTFLEGNEAACQRMLQGEFPEYIEKQFVDIMDYFGQSPFIVRSSSLLEDSFGNAFAGTYESYFCVNQGPREKRLEDFKNAVRKIYASAMNEKALIYRSQRGLLDQDEQMALLIQRVSGEFINNYFLPHIAGVGFSFNPYAWSDMIDPQAGVLRLVFGLGTRAVDRHDDDFIRVVALNAPERRPEVRLDDLREYTQKGIDVLNLKNNQLDACSFADVAMSYPELPIEMFASRDYQLAQLARQNNRRHIFPWILTFEKLLTKTQFPRDMHRMLKTLQDAYDYPVDIEFTCNFFKDGKYKINLLQCRPFQVVNRGEITEPPQYIPEHNLLIKDRAAIIGRSRVTPIDHFVYVVPSQFGELAIRERYAVARTIGELLHIPKFHQSKTIMLLGPGRWGTTTPALGVPISFSEINTVSVLCEIVTMRKDLVPDVSLGTHLFNELVEMGILYLALFPNRKQTLHFNSEFFENSPNHLTDFLPSAQSWTNVIRVVTAQDVKAVLNANVLTQNVVCYLQDDQA